MVIYRAIYLSAGIGERLRPLTYTTHKCLLEIKGKTIVEHFLDCLIYSEAEIDRVHIVIGHYGYKFRELLGNDYRGLKTQFLVNSLYKITGGAQSLYTAFNILRKHPCLVIDGDHYVDPELMKMLISSEYENCILVDDSKIPKFDEDTVAYGHEGTLDKLVWYPPYPPNYLGEAITIFKTSKEASHALAVILEDFLLEDGAAKREMVDAFNRLMRLFDFHYISTEEREWTEIDFEADLEMARRITF